MAVRLTKAWIPLDQAHVEKLTGHLGVYQLGNGGGEIFYIGVAGGRSRFGLRGELTAMLAAELTEVTCFRVEINMAYRTRHIELLQTFVHDHGHLPLHNTDVDIARLGRMRPAG
jgi:hypothetical protein